METKYNNLKKHELPELERKGFFRRWHYKPTQMPVGKKEYHFIADDLDDLKAILEHQNFKDLDLMHCKTLTPIELIVLSTRDLQFAAAQIFRYVEYDFRMETDIFVYKGAEAEMFLNVLKGLKTEG